MRQMIPSQMHCRVYACECMKEKDNYYETNQPNKQNPNKKQNLNNKNKQIKKKHNNTSTVRKIPLIFLTLN